MKEIQDFSKAMLADSKGVLLWGAREWGKLVFETLQNWMLKDDRLKSKDIDIVFIDRLKETSGFEGIDVIKEEAIEEYPEYDILICAPSAYTMILEDLKKLRGESLEHVFGISEILKQPMPMTYTSSLDCQKGEVLLERYEFYKTRNEKRGHSFSRNDIETLVLPFLAISVTERCSLNCEKCIAMVPYYDNPQNFSFEDMKPALERLMDAVDKIIDIGFVGGEAFMNKEFYKYLEWAIDERKIRHVTVLTNATIIPDERTIELLKDEKVAFGFDDYGVISSKKDDLVVLAKKHNLKYYIMRDECWQDIGTLERKHYSQEKRNAIFSNCSFRDCNIFLNGRFYRCQHEAHLDNLGICKSSETDYLDLMLENDGGGLGIRKKLVDLITKTEALEACDFCNDITQGMFYIPVAEQVTCRK